MPPLLANASWGPYYFFCSYHSHMWCSYLLIPALTTPAPSNHGCGSIVPAVTAAAASSASPPMVAAHPHNCGDRHGSIIHAATAVGIPPHPLSLTSASWGLFFVLLSFLTNNLFTGNTRWPVHATNTPLACKRELGGFFFCSYYFC
jgi:hypothetical protein